MGFADPVGVVELAEGTAVTTDPTTAALFHSSGVVFTAPVSLPVDGSAFYVGDFDNLQVAFVRTFGSAGFRATFEWFHDPTTSLRIGTSKFELPSGLLNLGFFDSIPVQGPYLRVQLEATTYGVTQVARMTILPRKGAGGALGAGDGLLISYTDPALAAGATTPIIVAANVFAGPATFSVLSAVGAWWAWVVGFRMDGSTDMVAAISGPASDIAVTAPVTLPSRISGVQGTNLDGAPISLYMALTVPSRRA